MFSPPMSTGSLTTQRPQLQGREDERASGGGDAGGGARVIFPFGDLHANAAQERQLFSGCQAVCGFFFQPTETAQVR